MTTPTSPEALTKLLEAERQGNDGRKAWNDQQPTGINSTLMLAGAVRTIDQLLALLTDQAQALTALQWERDQLAKSVYDAEEVCEDAGRPEGEYLRKSIEHFLGQLTERLVEKQRADAAERRCQTLEAQLKATRPVCFHPKVAEGYGVPPYCVDCGIEIKALTPPREEPPTP